MSSMSYCVISTLSTISFSLRLFERIRLPFPFRLTLRRDINQKLTSVNLLLVEVFRGVVLIKVYQQGLCI